MTRRRSPQAAPQAANDEFGQAVALDLGLELSVYSTGSESPLLEIRDGRRARVTRLASARAQAPWPTEQ